MAKPKIMADIAQVSEEIDALQDRIIWKPNSWKTENDAPSVYPNNTTTMFYSDGGSWDGVTNGVVKVEKYNNNVAKQSFFTYKNELVKYRLSYGGVWQGWQTVVTTDRLATDSGLPVISVTEANLDKYNTMSDGMPNGTYYKRIVANTVVVPEVGGGNWYLEGVRTSDKWEWQMIRAYHEGFIKFREKANGVWSKFRTIATTHKTDFSCTPATGFKIANQKCYVINNQVFISVALKTTDDSNFATFQTKKAFTVPTAYKPLLHPSVAISCSRVAQGGLPLGNDCANVWFDTGDVWVSNETITNTNYIIVTGSYFI